MAFTTWGSFPIGFRRMGALSQIDLSVVARWAIEHDFAHLDLSGPSIPADVKVLTDAALPIGTIDLLRWGELLSPDADRRRGAIEANVEHVRSLAGMGVTTFFAIAAPEDPSRPRAENFGYAVESYRAICRAARETGARIALEGAPGKPPHFATIGCTPADLRAFLAAVDSQALGINFDPSHAVRMGIDPVRMLWEFAPHVVHVHAKDTRILEDGLYEHGNLQQATFATPGKFGAYWWRYTAPGKGSVPWSQLFVVLTDSGYVGRISIELEDEDVAGEDAEREALIAARDFLAKT